MRTRLLCTFAMLSICLCAAARANAQDVGVLGGLNVSIVNFDPSIPHLYEDEFGFDNASVARQTGPFGGVQFSTPLGHNNLRLIIEGLVRQTGITIDADIADDTGQVTLSDKIRTTWIEVPVMVGIPVGAKAHVQAGMFFAMKAKQKEHVRFAFEDEVIEDDDVEGDDQTQLKGTNVGLAIGAQVQVTRMLDVGGRFNLGLTNIDNEPDSDFNSIKAGGFSIFVVFHPKRR